MHFLFLPLETKETKIDKKKKQTYKSLLIKIHSKSSKLIQISSKKVNKFLLSGSAHAQKDLDRFHLAC